MKTRLLFWLAWSTAALALQAQSYSINWSTIDGGGGTSTGGVYSVSGTIGQPDAGRMSGGNYTLDGGFWGGVAAVQTPGAPPLAIVWTAPANIVISWPYPSTDFQLQENSSLATTTWTNVTASPVQMGGEWQLPVSPPTGNRFYRLHHP